MKLLDLYCGGGGASMGYHRAGFEEILGVDIAPQPDYPFEFIQDGAIRVLADAAFLEEFDVIHASPPCQAHSALNPSNGRRYADLIPATRVLLKATGKPYVIENVDGAPLIDPIMQCGSMFGLGTAEHQLRRHRLFESNFKLFQLKCSHDNRPVIGVYGGKARLRRRTPHWGVNLPKSAGQEAMGIDWMTLTAMSQAIPPAYTEFIGKQLISLLRWGVAA